MKTRKLFFGLLAALAIAGCSSEENITADNGQTNSGEEAHYLSINILSGDGTTKSRAAGDQTNGGPGSATYEEGDENTVSDVRFYFFKENGDAALVKKSVSNGTTTYLNYVDFDNPSGNTTNMPNVEKMLDAIVVLNYDNDEERPYKIVAILNNKYTENGQPQHIVDGNKSLSALQAEIADYSATGARIENSNKPFLMTNSVYADGENIVVASDLADENLQQNEANAKSHPVDIYVERVVAKVRFNLSSSSLSGNTKETDSDGNIYVLAQQNTGSTSGTTKTNITTKDGTYLYIKLCGWNVTATADRSYLFKKVQNTTTWSTTANWGATSPWTYPTYHRSYWAQNPSGALIDVPTINNKENATSGAYIAYDNVNIKKTAKATEATVNGATTYDFIDDVAYVQENAANNNNGTKTNTTTKVIIAAQLCTKSTDGSYSPASIYEYANNRYVNEDDCKLMMINASTPNVYRVTTTGETADYDINSTGYIRITPNDVELKSAIKAGVIDSYTEEGNESYKSYLTIKDGSYFSISKESDGSYKATPLTTGKIDLTSVYANVYKGGKCYYYFPIQHFGYGVTGATFGQYGVVRNHIYDCDLTAIYGLGTPVPDPTEIIVPEKPSDDVYVAAKINILSWRIVNNNITLEW